MIDLTPLDVRNKRGDFRKGLRGYEPHEVDAFLETVADRLDVLVRDNLAMQERLEELRIRVERQEARETAVQEALVSAQALREEIQAQARREGDLLRREAEQDAQQVMAETEAWTERVRSEIDRRVAEARRDLEELERGRRRFLRSYRGLLEQALEVVEGEEARRVGLDVDLDDLRIFEGAAREGSGAGSAAPEDPEAAPPALASSIPEPPEESEPSEGPLAARPGGGPLVSPADVGEEAASPPAEGAAPSP